MKIKKAVIPAAGLGTRVLPASKSMPKEMLPIIDKPAIQYIVEEAVHSGIEDILIITSRGKTTVEDHFDRNPELEARLLASKKQEVYDEMWQSPRWQTSSMCGKRRRRFGSCSIVCKSFCRQRAVCRAVRG